MSDHACGLPRTRGPIRVARRAAVSMIVLTLLLTGCAEAGERTPGERTPGDRTAGEITAGELTPGALTPATATSKSE
jgi:hypothetical protein